MLAVMRSMNAVVGVVGVLLACSACGESDDGKKNGGGTVTDEWRAYCTGVFTKDYPVVEFDETRFTAHAGEEYLLSEYGDTFGAKAQMIYLWPGGPEEFEVTAATATTFPFTTSCPLNTA